LASVNCAVAQTALPQSPWYIEGSAGALWRMDASASTTFYNGLGVTGPGVNTIAYNPGPDFNLGFGYKLPFGFRIEAEAGYAHYTYDSISPLNTNGALPALNGSRLESESGGGHDQYSGTLNAFYDLPIPGWFTPYVGAGIGVSSLDTQVGHFAGPGGVPQFTQAGGRSTDAAMLAEAGLTITLDENWSVEPAYRFEKTLTSGNQYPSNENIFKLGLRYSFNAISPD
jgi:opacity protein-like surface antigen